MNSTTIGALTSSLDVVQLLPGCRRRRAAGKVQFSGSFACPQPARKQWVPLDHPEFKYEHEAPLFILSETRLNCTEVVRSLASTMRRVRKTLGLQERKFAALR
jgi:hypothetical protein